MDVVRELREWQPLTALLARIPRRVGRSRLLAAAGAGAELQLTCVSVCDEFVALGSDAGVVFWCDRRAPGEVQQLRCEVLLYHLVGDAATPPSTVADTAQ